MANAWSHPHGQNLIKNGFLNQGYLGSPWSVALTGAATSKIDCGSDAGLDNLADAQFTAETWLRSNVLTEQKLFVKTLTTVGWNGYFSSTLCRFTVKCGTTDATAFLGATALTDGKWHHIAITFNDAGDRKIYIAIDGVWAATYSDQVAGIGAVVDDSAQNFLLGSRLSSDGLNGNLGWCRISNNARYTPGTNFVPVRTPPAADANTLAQWNMSEGTGTTVDNIGTIGAAADGTITAGTWTPAWYDEGTPDLNDVSVESNGLTTSIDCGSGASIDNLAAGANGFTAEGWFRANTSGKALQGVFFNKTGSAAEGWKVSFNANTVSVIVYFATTNISKTVTFVPDKRWHHWAWTFKDDSAGGDKKVYIYMDRVLVGTSVAGVGAPVADATRNLLLCNNGTNAYVFEGGFGWVRLSNVVRAITTETYGRFNPPDPADANTMLQLNMTEGAGNPQDSSGEGNHGTLSNGTWNNTRDLAVDSPGYQVYNGGHLLYANAADEGIKQTFTGLTPGADYVVRAVAFAGIGGTAQPKLVVYDETNAAVITTLNGDWQNEIVANGTFTTDTLWTKGTGWTIDAADNNMASCDGSQTAVSNLSQAIANQLNGGLVLTRLYKLVYTISGYSAGTVTPKMGSGTSGTARSSDATFTEYLRCAGDTTLYFAADADFIGNIDNVSITFIPEYNHPDVLLCSFELPALCTSISVKVISAAVGVLGIHQVELLTPTLWADPSFEVGTAPADIGTVVSSAQSNTRAHTGTYSWKVVTDAANEGIQLALTTVVGKFYRIGVWVYCEAGSAKFANISLQKALAVGTVTGAGINYWTRITGVFRATAVTTNLQILATAAQTFYIDDFDAVIVDDVTLTAAPASQANSLEGSGIRVDGGDILPQPILKMAATKGRADFYVTQRHAAADVAKFGEATPIIAYFGTTGNKFYVGWSAANTVILGIDCVGGADVTSTWNATGAILANVAYKFSIRYTSTKIELWVDNVLKITVTTAINFTTIPATVKWGASLTGTQQIDGVFS